jgi:hypothetical protein
MEEIKFLTVEIFKSFLKNAMDYAFTQMMLETSHVAQIHLKHSGIYDILKYQKKCLLTLDVSGIAGHLRLSEIDDELRQYLNVYFGKLNWADKMIEHEYLLEGRHYDIDHSGKVTDIHMIRLRQIIEMISDDEYRNDFISSAFECYDLALQKLSVDFTTTFRYRLCDGGNKVRLANCTFTMGFQPGNILKCVLNSLPENADEYVHGFLESVKVLWYTIVQILKHMDTILKSIAIEYPSDRIFAHPGFLTFKTGGNCYKAVIGNVSLTVLVVYLIERKDTLEVFREEVREGKELVKSIVLDIDSSDTVRQVLRQLNDGKLYNDFVARSIEVYDETVDYFSTNYINTTVASIHPDVLLSSFRCGATFLVYAL